MPIKSTVRDLFTSALRSPFLRRVTATAIGIAALVLLTGLGTAQTVTFIYNFTGEASGKPSYVIPAQGQDGRLYGTSFGFPGTMGSIFRVSTTGQGRELAAFNGTNGANPIGGVTLASDGSFYGTTYLGGSANFGVLFKVSPSGAYTVLHEFAGGADGANPWEPPIQGSDGNFYGTSSGNVNSTVYRYSPSAGFSTIYQFDQTHGQSVLASVIQGTDGHLYGVAEVGGAHNCGTIFKMTTSGTILWYYSFTCRAGGQFPAVPLVQAADGSFYGTTSQGGDQHNDGTIFHLDGSGNVSVLYQLSRGALGTLPYGLMQATDGNLYGVAGGGSFQQGVLFRLKTDGTYTVLHTFAKETGAEPLDAPVQHTNGLLYGTTAAGGTHPFGTVYSVDLSLGPFIALVRYAGRIGREAQILGQGLTGTSSVTFNGVSATSFSVVSDTYMTAVVPSGATTGPVVVTTPTGSLTSNKNFSIIP